MPGFMHIIEFARAADLDGFLRESDPSFEGFVGDQSDAAFAVGGVDAAIAHSAARSVTQRFAGGTYGKAAGRYLFHVGLPVPHEFRDDFLSWYRDEHLPMLLEADGWDGCRIVEEKVEQGLLFHALHQLSHRKALDSAERKRSRATPWFERLAQNAWFDKGFSRTLYVRANYS
jgi:hypothetical protein